MKNSLRIHKWTHNEFNIFILGVFDTPSLFFVFERAGDQSKEAKESRIQFYKNYE